MSETQQRSTTISVLLWIAQGLLALSLLWAAGLKLFQSPATLAAMWPWTGEIAPVLVKLTGVVDLLGALGLVLPALLRVKPKLTPIAALALVVLMICAIIFHVSRGEASLIGVNVVFAALAAFIAWGRW